MHQVGVPVVCGQANTQTGDQRSLPEAFLMVPLEQGVGSLMAPTAVAPSQLLVIS